MQKIDPNIEDDAFRKIMKEKLEGYSLPVSDEVWNKIESSLNKKPRKVVLWPWISGIVAAAAVVLFILFVYPLDDKAKRTDNDETTSSLSGDAKKIDSEKDFVIRETKDASARHYEEEVRSNLPTDSLKNESGLFRHERLAMTSDDLSRHCEEEVRSNLPTDSLKNESGLLRRERLAMTSDDPFGEDSHSIKKVKKRKSIGLSLGSGGNLTAMNTHSDNLMFNNIIGQLLRNSFPNSMYVNNMAFKDGLQQFLPGDFPEVTYRVPLSIGLTVKKEIDRTFSLETGLVYTFLDTRFENRSLRRKALLQLHYVGIPLNVQARILGNKNSDWDIYLSAGGMVEKGIYSHYKQMSTANNNPVVEIVSNDRIDGLQYSLSFAPGIDYKIYRNYSIYLEPRISYYFDNKQPFSARTEHPVVIGINAGLRFYW